MKPPASVKIGSYRFKIRLMELNEFNTEPDRPLLGMCEWVSQEIRIDPDQQGPEMLRDTVWHEIKHVCWTIAALPIKYCDEERAIGGLSPIELMVLRDNPKLVEYLTAA